MWQPPRDTRGVCSGTRVSNWVLCVAHGAVGEREVDTGRGHDWGGAREDLGNIIRGSMCPPLRQGQVSVLREGPAGT